MTIKELVALQAERELGDRHLIELRGDGFTIAHTDEERASGMLLTDCPLHQWLLEQSEAPMPHGIYTYDQFDLLGFSLLPELP